MRRLREYQIGKLKTLVHELRESRENLSITQDRIRAYVLPTDVPLQLEKGKRWWEGQVRWLQRQISQLGILLVKPLPQSMFSVPREGLIIAGEPKRFQEWQGNPVKVPREIVCEEEGLYALEVEGNSMANSLVHEGDLAIMKLQAHEGDLVIMRHQQYADDGDMVAVHLPDEDEATLKYCHFHYESNRIRLQPANSTMQAMYYDDPDKVNVQGKVVAVIRILSEQNARLYIPWANRSPGLIMWAEEL